MIESYDNFNTFQKQNIYVHNCKLTCIFGSATIFQQKGVQQGIHLRVWFSAKQLSKQNDYSTWPSSQHNACMMFTVVVIVFTYMVKLKLWD